MYESSKVVGDFISSWGWKSSNLMPWHAEAKSYKNERKATETEFLSGGGKIIFPFPEIEII